MKGSIKWRTGQRSAGCPGRSRWVRRSPRTIEMSENTVRAAIASDRPPKFGARPAGRSSIQAEPRFRPCSKAYPVDPGDGDRPADRVGPFHPGAAGTGRGAPAGLPAAGPGVPTAPASRSPSAGMRCRTHSVRVAVRSVDSATVPGRFTVSQRSRRRLRRRWPGVAAGSALGGPARRTPGQSAEQSSQYGWTNVSPNGANAQRSPRIRCPGAAGRAIPLATLLGDPLADSKDGQVPSGSAAPDRAIVEPVFSIASS